MSQNINSAVEDALPLSGVQVVDEFSCVVFVALLIPTQNKKVKIDPSINPHILNNDTISYSRFDHTFEWFCKEHATASTRTFKMHFAVIKSYLSTKPR